MNVIASVSRMERVMDEINANLVQTNAKLDFALIELRLLATAVERLLGLR